MSVNGRVAAAVVGVVAVVGLTALLMGVVGPELVGGPGDGSTPGPVAVPVPDLAAPEGFAVAVYAGDDLGGGERFVAGPQAGPRVLRFHEGVLYASVPDRGDGHDRIVALPDDDGDGVADRVVTVLESPEISDAHGFDFHDGHLYVANHDRDGDRNDVVRYRMDGLAPDVDSRTVLVSVLPDRGDFYHWTRTLAVHDGHLYVSVGSESNVDEPSGGWHAAVTRCDLDGSDCERYARGLRNAVGLAFHDGRLYAADNARDGLGGNVPDELNVLERGANYGWPYCYGHNTPDPVFEEPRDCSDREPPVLTLEAHSVPLGMAFYTGEQFPAAYRDDLFVALHGSYNADPAVGYELLRVPYEDGAFGTPEPFVTGWYASDGDDDLYEVGQDVYGRPADVAVGPDGSLYLSDDAGGRIYRIHYVGDESPGENAERRPG